MESSGGVGLEISAEGTRVCNPCAGGGGGNCLGGVAEVQGEDSPTQIGKCNRSLVLARLGDPIRQCYPSEGSQSEREDFTEVTLE